MPDSVKARVVEAVDARRDQLLGLARAILQNPELGYREVETAGLVRRVLDELRVPHRDGLALTGVKALLDTGRPGPTVAIPGELDSIGATGHPHANPETGAAHACGHHCQIAAMLGAGMALLDAGALAELSGRVVLFAVPAEEYVAVVNPAKALALTTVDLLASEAREARRVVALHRPAMTRDAYLAQARSLLREERYRAEA